MAIEEIRNKYIKTKPLEDKLNILVVEDTLIHQESAKITLAKYANRLDVVGDFEGARYALKNNLYDIVMTDDNMPLGLVRGVNNEHDQQYPLGSKMGERERKDSYGFKTAVLAMKHGVPNAVIVSSGNHHDGANPYVLEDVFGESSIKMGDSEISIHPGEDLIEIKDSEANEIISKHIGGNGDIYTTENGNYLLTRDMLDEIHRHYNDIKKKNGEFTKEEAYAFDKTDYFSIEKGVSRKNWADSLEKTLGLPCRSVERDVEGDYKRGKIFDSTDEEIGEQIKFRLEKGLEKFIR